MAIAIGDHTKMKSNVLEPTDDTLKKSNTTPTLITIDNESPNLERALQEAVKVAGIGLWDWDIITNRVLFSKEWKQQLGYTDHEIVNDLHEWKSRIHPEDIDVVMHYMETALKENEKTGTIEYRIKHRNGTYRWIKTQATAHYDQNQHPIRILGTNIDITKHKQIELQLIQQKNTITLNNKIANIFITQNRKDIVPLIIETIKQVVYCQYVFIGFFNDAGALLPPDLLHNPQTQDYGNPETNHYELPWIKLWDYFIYEKHTIIVNDIEKSGFSEFSNAMLLPLVNQNNLIGHVCLVNKRDGFLAVDQNLLESAAAQIAPVLAALIEEARQKQKHATLEEQLRQSQKMEAIGKLAGGIAHEFNNMLTIINIATDFTIQALRPQDPLIKDVYKIQDAGKRAATLTKQLLAFSRKQALRPVTLNLNTIITSLRPMLQRLMGETIQCKVILDPLLNSIVADPTQVEQVLMNLCLNARDAMPTGGSITIETANIYLDKDFTTVHADMVPGNHIMLAIRDTGVGISPEEKDRIFEPFYTTKSIEKGSGLGLATVFGIIKQSKGIILVDSLPRKGTHFLIYLPQSTAETEPHVSPQKLPNALAGTETILLVEDEHAVLELTERILTTAGYTVFTADNGADALEIFERQQNDIDLLLTDVIIPNISGKSLASRLQKLKPSLKVIYMSGYTNNPIAHHGIIEDTLNFINKPFTVNTLLETISATLSL